MKRYRIREEVHGDGTVTYYPERKGFLFWHCFVEGSGAWRQAVSYRFREQALDHIHKHRRELQAQAVVSKTYTEI